MDFLEQRHIGPNESEQREMLDSVGVKSLEQLIEQTIPSDILLKQPLSLEEPMPEHSYLEHVVRLAQENAQSYSLIGKGWYETVTPAVIQRNVLENPVWYTSYTPYQAEISQGRLEALFLFQTAVSDLTGLPLANCSMLDEATAAAEAMNMMFNLRTKEQVRAGANKLFVDFRVFDNTLQVLRTKAEATGIEISVGMFENKSFDESYFGAIVQYPNSEGNIPDYKFFAKKVHEHNGKLAVGADLMALALLKTPASWGADICFGTTQRFGIPMSFGGPSAGYLSTREEFKRDMPGRIVGLSKDKYGRPAYRLALQTREQHIKRERATSNICTAQALTAIMAAMYCVYHGPQGLRSIAKEIHSKAVYLNELLQAFGYEQLNDQFFDTLRIKIESEGQYFYILEHLKKAALSVCVEGDKLISLNIGEGMTLEQFNTLANIFVRAQKGKAMAITAEQLEQDLWAIDEQNEREVDYLQQPVFNQNHTETQMMRFIKKLERKDISLTHSMIPLGSCTMKLNPAAAMIPITFSGFTHCHPLDKSFEAKGYQTMVSELKQMLCEITGFDVCTLQPTSGAAGEYTGMITIRRQLKLIKQLHRNIILIPQSAHGTNPASCVQAGFTPITVRCDEGGNIDLQDWKEKAEQYADTLAGCMITYPSTHGIFEQDIKQMCQVVHKHGGYVYMDGANLNAQVGLTNPATIGADLCHLNLHKTFAAPHGGGGPGAGAVCATNALSRALPTANRCRVSSALYGNALISLISYGYIKMMGSEGLKHASQVAILNANYLAAKLEPYYPIVYKGKNGRVGHELILDCRQFKSVGITETDIAKRLMDYGYHAPTLSFPVHGTLMVEPTESENKHELDRFIDAMIHIRQEIADIEEGRADKTDNLLLNAPHPEYEAMQEWSHPYSRMQAYYPTEWVAENKMQVPVARVDNGFGDRNLIAKL